MRHKSICTRLHTYFKLNKVVIRCGIGRPSKKQQSPLLSGLLQSDWMRISAVRNSNVHLCSKSGLCLDHVLEAQLIVILWISDLYVCLLMCRHSCCTPPPPPPPRHSTLLTDSESDEISFFLFLAEDCITAVSEGLGPCQAKNLTILTSFTVSREVEFRKLYQIAELCLQQ